MGQTTARHFRDKLAMRFKAADAGVPVPAFSSLFNDDDIHQFTQKVAAPWIVKPRGQASATGMKKIYSADELWSHLEKLGAITAQRELAYGVAQGPTDRHEDCADGVTLLLTWPGNACGRNPPRRGETLSYS